MKNLQKRKGILIALLSLACAFIVAGSAIVIFTHISNNKNASQEYDDEWTNNY